MRSIVLCELCGRLLMVMFVTDAERIEKLERSVDEYKTLVRPLEEENGRLKRGLLGQKAERFWTNGAQLSLAMLEMAVASGERVADGSPEAEQIIAEYTRGKAKRKPLPENLPRVPIEILQLEVHPADGRQHHRTPRADGATGSRLADGRRLLELAAPRRRKSEEDLRRKRLRPVQQSRSVRVRRQQQRPVSRGPAVKARANVRADGSPITFEPG